MTEEQQRSTFVTAVAWVFIVLSGFATVISILQNIMIFTMFRGAEISQAMRANPPAGMPPAASFVAEHFYFFFSRSCWCRPSRSPVPSVCSSAATGRA